MLQYDDQEIVQLILAGDTDVVAFIFPQRSVDVSVVISLHRGRHLDHLVVLPHDFHGCIERCFAVTIYDDIL